MGHTHRTRPALRTGVVRTSDTMRSDRREEHGEGRRHGRGRVHRSQPAAAARADASGRRAGRRRRPVDRRPREPRRGRAELWSRDASSTATCSTRPSPGPTPSCTWRRCRRSPGRCADPLTSHHANATGTLEVLEAVRRAGSPHLVVASSSSVYGANRELPKRETMRTAPLSPYAVSKLATEAYALAHASCYDLDVLAFRFFNVFGPLQAAGHAYAAVVPAFVDAAVAGQAARRCTATARRPGTSPTSAPCATSSSTPSAGASPHDTAVNLAFGTRTSLTGLVAELEERARSAARGGARRPPRRATCATRRRTTRCCAACSRARSRSSCAPGWRRQSTGSGSADASGSRRQHGRPRAPSTWRWVRAQLRSSRSMPRPVEASPRSVPGLVLIGGRGVLYAARTPGAGRVERRRPATS